MVLSSGGTLFIVTKYLFYKRALLRTITGLWNQDSCHEMFKDGYILTLQYIYSVSCFLSQIQMNLR